MKNIDTISLELWLLSSNIRRLNLKAKDPNIECAHKLILKALKELKKIV